MSNNEPTRCDYESGLCCMAAHANAKPPWTCDCPCHTTKCSGWLAPEELCPCPNHLIPPALAVDDWVEQLELILYGKTGNTWEKSRLDAIRSLFVGIALRSAIKEEKK